MQLGLLIKEEALEDIQKAFDYYNEKSPKLGNRFLDTLDYYFERISKFPEHYQIRRKTHFAHADGVVATSERLGRVRKSDSY